MASKKGKTAGTGNSLAGRKVLVTGVSSGMGRAIARLFAAEGAQLALVDWAEKGLKQVAKETGGLALHADVSSIPAVEALVKQAAKHMGGLDGIVNAAGIFGRVSIEKVTPEYWHKVIGVNLTGPFMIVRAALPHLRKAKTATVVNIASSGALLPGAEMSAYVSSKGGMIGMTKSFANELGPKIRVNCICPGMIRTAITEALYDSIKALEQTAASRSVLQRIGTAEEIAQATLFYTSDQSAFITGTTLAVDGGKTFH